MMLVLREPQHERKNSTDFNRSPVRLELCRKMNGYFSDLQGAVAIGLDFVAANSLTLRR